MKNQTKIKKVNWITLAIVLIVNIVSAVLTVYDLNNQTPSAFGDEEQSRVEFRWGMLHTMFFLVVLMLASILLAGWKRLFPFNAPLAIILTGFCYQLFFLTFIVGWVGMQGTLGMLVSFFIGMNLCIAYTVSMLSERRNAAKTKN